MKASKNFPKVSLDEYAKARETLCTSTILSCNHIGDETCMICCYNSKNIVPLDETGKPNPNGYFVKGVKFYSFVNSIDAKKEYPVRYWIDNAGNKHYEWKLLKGEDLTENQIFELFKFHSFPAKSVTDEEIEVLLNDYESYCKTFISKDLIKNYIKQRNNEK